MKTKTSIPLLILFSVILISCHKKEIDNIPESNAPIFKAEGSLNGANFSIIAGDNGAYMDSYSEKINGVLEFTGNLSNENIEIELGIYNGNIDSPFSLPQIQINSLDWALHSGQTLATLSKNSFANAYKIHEIKWFSGNTLLGIDTASITEPGKYDILAYVTFIDGSTASLRNELILGYETKANFNLRFDLFPSGDMNAYIDIISGEVAGVTWSIDGEEETSLQTNFSRNITDNVGHEVTAIVHFTNGVVRTKSFYVDGSLHGNNIPDFTTFEQSAANIQSIKQDYKALLIIRKDNVEYRSDFIGNTSAAVQIDNIEYYGLNDDGNKVYKITAEITTNLKNMNTNAIVNTHFKTVYGIEIK